MMKKREDLDMATIVDEAISNYADSRKLTGAVPFEQMSQAQLKRMREVFLPVIWSAVPAILTQLNAKAILAEETQEEILADFKVPDTLEGLIQ
ncbi:hypothetical protein [Arthrobacter methylotrophus]|uniref:Uncharacterized protein n=1 Tax=Arthrobacter methylotrophus TaxID=121291 RepID=A0ABV5UP54_9MICC